MLTAAIAAGAALRDAMDAAAQGDRGAVAGAQQAERAATEAVIVAAAGHIEDAGHQATETFRQRMQATVRAAQLDPDVAERWRGGRLETDEEASVFGLAPGATAPEPARRAARTRTPPPSAPSDAADEPRDELDDTDPAGDAEAVATADRAAAREAEERRREAVATHQRLRKEADRLDTRASRLEAKAEHLEQQAGGARREADDARAAADDARSSADAADPDRPDGPNPG